MAIELLVVSHRLLLTSEETNTQRDILEIIEKCTLAFQEKLILERNNTNNSTGGGGGGGVATVGDGNTETAGSEIVAKGSIGSDVGDNNTETTTTTIESEIVAKKSVVFSVLEVCTFLVTKYAKDLVVSAGLVTGSVTRKPSNCLIFSKL